MAYADFNDLYAVGFNQTARGQLTDVQLSAALQNASDYADNFFRARYGQAAVPLVQWDEQVTQAVAQEAAWRLIRQRGVRPGSQDWELFEYGHREAMGFFDKVQRQQAHPLVTLAASDQPGSQQPMIISSSVVNLATGGRAPNRGW